MASIYIEGTDEVAPADGCIHCGRPKSGHGLRSHGLWVKPDGGTVKLRFRTRQAEGG